jgi:hypothetical protein
MLTMPSFAIILTTTSPACAAARAGCYFQGQGWRLWTPTGAVRELPPTQALCRRKGRWRLAEGKSLHLSQGAPGRRIRKCAAWAAASKLQLRRWSGICSPVCVHAEKFTAVFADNLRPAVGRPGWPALR